MPPVDIYFFHPTHFSRALQNFHFAQFRLYNMKHDYIQATIITVEVSAVVTFALKKAPKTQSEK
jgi:hypothetical protein